MNKLKTQIQLVPEIFRMIINIFISRSEHFDMINFRILRIINLHFSYWGRQEDYTLKFNVGISSSELYDPYFKLTILSISIRLPKIK